MKKILMIVLDGFGMREDIYGNAIKNAGMNNFINIWNNYPHCLLKSSGSVIGLPDKQCSNSKLGHKIIGTGREINNKLTDTNDFFKRAKLKYNNKFNVMIQSLKDDLSKNLHITHLLSDGGVSSHINHLKSFLEILKENEVENTIYLHFISDGRDVDRYSFKKYFMEIKPFIKNNVYVGTICGRYYALDETQDYRRTKVYYDLLFNGHGIDANNVDRVVDKCYEKKLSDEIMPPLKSRKFEGVNRNDVIVMLNFDKETQAQILEQIYSKDFIEFDTKEFLGEVYSLYEINESINNNYFLSSPKYEKTLPEYLSILGLTQAYIYESIKGPSVNYYLNGERYLKLENCDTFSLESPIVDNFDAKPEMSSLAIAKTAINCMEEDYDFIFVNFANPDEVGHTGNYPATINGLQAIDVCLSKILSVAEENFYKIVITSSHGKADTIIDRDNNVITKNTTSPVPFIIMDKRIKLKNGNLTSIAPTILKYMDIAIPKEMKKTEILIEKK